jgi:hypothetical protein
VKQISISELFGHARASRAIRGVNQLDRAHEAYRTTTYPGLPPSNCQV